MGPTIEATALTKEEPPKAPAPPNPYVAGRPLTGSARDLFVGRADAFAWLRANLAAALPNVLILYGARRIGKTSLLYQLVEGERGDAMNRQADRRGLPVYLDLQRFATADTASLLQGIAGSISRRLEKLSVAPTPGAFAAGQSPYRAFDNYLDNLAGAFAERHRILLVVDEIEQLQRGIESGRLDPEFLDYWRSALQHAPGIAFVLSGSTRLMDATWSEVVHLGVSLELGPLARGEAEQLLAMPAAPWLEFEPDALDRSWEWTRGYPYFVQQLGHEVFTRVVSPGLTNVTVSAELVDACAGTIVSNYDAHLRYLWDRATKDERQVLARISRSPSAEQPRAPAGTVPRMPVELNATGDRQVLAGLQRQSLIVPTAGGAGETGYAIFNGLFREWIGRQPAAGHDADGTGVGL